MRIAPLAACALTAFLAAPAAVPAFAAAEGRSALRWKLEIGPDPARTHCAGRLVVETEKRGRQVYWYFVYTIGLRHDRPVPLHLNVVAETDALHGAVVEGYYPDAMARIRAKFGDDVLDCVQLEGRELAPGETVRAAAVFQFRRPDGSLEDDVDRIVLRFGGYADPVKKMGLQAVREDVELRMTFERYGDAYDAYRESVRYVGQEERVVG